MKKISVEHGLGTQREKDEYDLATERLLSRKPSKLSWIDGRPPKREELYDRPVLRRSWTSEK